MRAAGFSRAQVELVFDVIDEGRGFHSQRLSDFARATADRVYGAVPRKDGSTLPELFARFEEWQKTRDEIWAAEEDGFQHSEYCLDDMGASDDEGVELLGALMNLLKDDEVFQDTMLGS